MKASKPDKMRHAKKGSKYTYPSRQQCIARAGGVEGPKPTHEYYT